VILAQAVDGARWVRHDPHGRRVMIWREGSDLIEIVDQVTGELRGHWPLEVVSAEGAANRAAERMRSGY